ncbi:hypothetical protein QE152_g15924 [Popillia japonica]|uniref:Uncharacterized protein n=1 Tax=Popillia japonica TaxID=7064 RepID=A0AAW1L7M1_POPJA
MHKTGRRGVVHDNALGLRPQVKMVESGSRHSLYYGMRNGYRYGDYKRHKSRWSKVAHDILYTMACEMDIDMAIISEPNINISLSHNCIMDKNRNVAIYIRNRNMGIQGCSVGEGIVCIKWKDWCIYGCCLY